MSKGPLVAVLGAGREAFLVALHQALDNTRAQAKAAPPSGLQLQSFASVEDTVGADQRWLLAWELDQQSHTQEALTALAHHHALRQALNDRGLAYQVLRGSLSERVAHALQSLAPCWPELAALLPRTGLASRRPASLSCDRCSDPDCEHRSFTQLIKNRSAD